jgi:hypothetical protein
MLTPNNSTLHARILNIACNVSDRALRDCIQRIANNNLSGYTVSYVDAVQITADYFRDAIASPYSTAQFQHFFQLCLDECRGELSHIEFFNQELPF